MTRREHLLDAAVVAAVALLAGAFVLSRGFYALSDDDFSRVVIAQRFARAPSLDPSGTSWLPFPFWVTGAAMALLERSLTVARLVAVASSVAALILVHRAALLLGATRREAVLGATLAGILPTAAHLGASFQPEALTAGLVVFAAATTQVDGSWRAWGGVALLAATLSRYEAWPVAVAFAALGSLDAGAALRHGAPRRVALHLGAAGLALAGPLAWVLHGVARHGDALFFVHRVTAYRRALGVHESTAAALAAYPLAALRAEPELCAIGAVVTGLAVLAARARDPGAARATPSEPAPGLPPLPRRFVSLLACLVACLVAGRVLDGAPTHHDERALLPLFWGGAVLALRYALRDLAKARLAQVGVVLVLLAAGVARAAADPDPGAPREAERRAGQLARNLAPGAALVVDTPDYGYFAVIAAFGAPERAAPLATHDPRDRDGEAARRDPATFTRAARDRCVPAAAGCVLVLHGAHADLLESGGTPLATAEPFTLLSLGGASGGSP